MIMTTRMGPVSWVRSHSHVTDRAAAPVNFEEKKNKTTTRFGAAEAGARKKFTKDTDNLSR
jgi:hypothetical protein